MSNAGHGQQSSVGVVVVQCGVHVFKCFNEACDFQAMSVTEHSALSFYRGLSLVELGRLKDATLLYEDMKDFALGELRRDAKIDYFPTSLPLLLVFEDDLDQTKNAQALFSLLTRGKGTKIGFETGAATIDAEFESVTHQIPGRRPELRTARNRAGTVMTCTSAKHAKFPNRRSVTPSKTHYISLDLPSEAEQADKEGHNKPERSGGCVCGVPCQRRLLGW